jgi:hypothetical protein
MYTYEISGLKAIIYKDGEEFSVVGPWSENNPSGPRVWAEGFCEGENNQLLAPDPEPTPEPTEE